MMTDQTIRLESLQESHLQPPCEQQLEFKLNMYFASTSTFTRSTMADPEHGSLGTEPTPELRRGGGPLPVSGSSMTTHRIGKDAWWQVGFHLVAAVNTAFILGYPALIMSFLGWEAGIILFIGGGLVSLYNNCLLGSLHEIGHVRHIRYRDLMGYVYGPVGYHITWITQYANLSIANIGLIILGGQSLKSLAGVSGVSGMILPHWIAISGLIFLAFAVFVPNLSSLRYFTAFSPVLSFIYVMIALIISIKDGISNPPRDYSRLGTKVEQTFNGIGALATIAFAFNTGILPEIQATIRSPTTTNIYKALALQFTIGSIPFVVITLVGYWAYGNAVYPYLLINLSGPKWAIIFANVAALLQAIIVFFIFAAPVYEFLDTFIAGRMVPGVDMVPTHDFTMKKILLRLVFRGVFIGISTFFGCLLPFFGDFIALTGSLAAFTLQGAFIHHLMIKVRGEIYGKGRLLWHWVNVVVNVMVMFACLAASIHYIIHDSKTYKPFADL